MILIVSTDQIDVESITNMSHKIRKQIELSF